MIQVQKNQTLLPEKELGLPPDFESVPWFDLLCISADELAERIDGLKPSMVRNWKKTGIPLKWVPHVEVATKFKVTRFDMRPDYFGTGKR